jgi:hypothetical protein
VSHPPDRPRGRPGAHPPAARPTTPYTSTTPYRPADVIRDLVTLLRGHGLDRVYWSACAVFAVVSVAEGLTVWCDGRRLCWRHAGSGTTWPAADTHGAAGRLAELVRQSSQP